ncbi:class I SAM-dependent methyltransferase [Paramaledivibacter caminithermalis]|jgi:2-polyprenyl-6-hydroxyphenyl methylase/3-demethylubiquinone-9 3-methyltransferase|uniref:2-polyprenyl-6-hydroxyphenyl methylase / 3-demethylubiquinone-9 3-methyltransferase n=1 Tax=Paramaledivibacter caminithermalis (strain DSM 15212 / CIP 107654 / DViRD3) TaxID=1121301 RepID=A0A1M6U7G5_PARC5|nr:class I SAM-dependent methyltransferase [Paramaledivibacter caminithermalis]SHK65137.1 2-polyprenyl-6-hydroxyphenyl methylase / 3-demethylubiquinone-9 3-methyltransferase [Paramaledivibacter caminithermalis DSM 15212]
MGDINYYAQKLNSQKLFKAYETQIPRVKQYLDAEISFVRDNLTGSEKVLELGAGYGRIVKELAGNCKSIVGIDISDENVSLGKEYLKDTPNAEIMTMDVHNLTFKEKFDVILCLQNGLSAMKITSSDLIKEILEMVVDGGKVYFSTYSEKFWEYRVMWFKEQAKKGLLGELDLDKTKDGIIICKDGFKAITHTLEDLKKIGDLSGYEYHIQEVDESSVFLIIYKK